MSRNRRVLIEQLCRVLVPALEQRGFRTLPLGGEDSRSAEMRSSFPLGRLMRARSDGHDQVEIQLDKRGSDAFRLNIGFVPTAGVVAAGTKVEPDAVWVHYLPIWYGMYRRPLTGRWFKPPFWKPRTALEYERLVGYVATLLPEIDTALLHQKPGRHLKLFRDPDAI